MYRVKSIAGLKEAKAEVSTVAGYGSMFGNIDSDNEVIVPGAFSKSIQERGPGSSAPRIKHLWMHSVYEPIAKVEVLKEDDSGLYFESKFGSDTFSQDKLKQHVDGIITEFSIGFQVIKSEDIMDDNGNRQYRKLLELKLWEISSVTWGANALTHVTDLKSLSREDRIVQLNDRQDRLMKALRDTKYNDDSKERFEIEYKQIQEIINSLLKEESGDPTPVEEPDEGQYSKLVDDIFNQIKI